MSEKPCLKDLFSTMRMLRDGYREPDGLGRSHPQKTRETLAHQMDWLLREFGHLDPGATMEEFNER